MILEKGNRILVKNQDTNKYQNGIYVVADLQLKEQLSKLILDIRQISDVFDVRRF